MCSALPEPVEGVIAHCLILLCIFNLEEFGKIHCSFCDHFMLVHTRNTASFKLPNTPLYLLLFSQMLKEL